VLGVLDDAVGAVVLLDGSLELDDDGSGAGVVDVLGVGVSLPEGVAVELLPLGVGALLLVSPLSDDDGIDELLDAAASLLDPLDELLSADDDELDDEEPGAEELGVGSLLGGSTLDEGKLSLLDSEPELDDELDELLLDDGLLLLELLEDGSLDDELELLLLDDDSLLDDEEEDELDEPLDEGSLDEELEPLLLDELDDESLLLLEELELIDELEELGLLLDELEELDGHSHFGTQIFLPQIVISQQSPASCTSNSAQGSGFEVLGLDGVLGFDGVLGLESDDEELDSQQIGTWQSSPSSIETN